MHWFVPFVLVLGVALAGCITLAAADRHTVSVLITLEGAPAETVERTVAVPIEAALSRLEGVERVHSTSRDGNCAIEVDVVGKDAAQTLALVEAQVLAVWREMRAPASRPLVVLKAAETHPALRLSRPPWLPEAPS